MIAALRKRADEDSGFTLIELLVVVIIIGILAAIAIPVFLNQRRSAWEGETTSALRNIAMDIEATATGAGGDYTVVDDPADIVTYLQDELGQTGQGDPVTVDFAAVQADGATEATGSDDVAGFLLCGTHANLDDPDRSVLYDSTAGGLQDWHENDDCSAALP